MSSGVKRPQVQTGVTDQPPASMVSMDVVPPMMHRPRLSQPFPVARPDSERVRPSDDSFPHRKVGVNTKTVPGIMSRVCSQQKHGKAVFLRVPFRRHATFRSVPWWPVPARFRSRATAAEFRNRSRHPSSAVSFQRWGIRDVQPYNFCIAETIT